MEMLEAILGRRSVRKYKGTPIPDEHLKQILEAGRQAPSAANRQPWHYILVGEADQKKWVAEACNGQMWMADAAYILVAVGLPETSQKWYRVDVAIAVENMVLAAHSLGYGTCWIGAFKGDDLKELCGIPKEMEVVVCTPLGVPDVEPAARPRKSGDEIFSVGQHGCPLDI